MHAYPLTPCVLWRAPGLKYGSRNVLADSSIREGVKKFTGWPTIPQVSSVDSCRGMAAGHTRCTVSLCCWCCRHCVAHAAPVCSKQRDTNCMLPDPHPRTAHCQQPQVFACMPVMSDMRLVHCN
jgi:hypothetical protein